MTAASGGKIPPPQREANMKTEMKATHTPGPWDHQGIYIVDSLGNIIAKVPFLNDREIKEANVSLIAAAPELLKQLKNTAMEYHQKVCATKRFHDCNGILCGRNRILIAKAEGGK